MKLITSLLLSFFLLGFGDSSDAIAKTKKVTGKLYFSEANCLVLKTRAGVKYNLKNYGSLTGGKRVRLELELLPKSEKVCDGPGRPASVVQVIKIYAPAKLKSKQESSSSLLQKQ
jgi:hypothetical protein